MIVEFHSITDKYLKLVAENQLQIGIAEER